MLTVCLLALLGGEVLQTQALPPGRVTLAWTHSIERVRWEEDYEAVPSTAGPRLHLREARVKGSAAGMEPPPDARYRDGWYRYRPSGPGIERLDLLATTHTGPYELCTNGRCRTLEDRIPLPSVTSWRLAPCAAQ